MKHWMGKLILCLMLCMLLVGCGEKKDNDEKATETPTPTTEVKEEPSATPTKQVSVLTPTPTPVGPLETSLCERYADFFPVGTCFPASYLSNPAILEIVTKQFNSITCENEMKPDALFDVAKSKAQGEVVVTFPTNTTRILDWAQENNFKMRGHTLVWHSQTPEEFFREGFEKSGALISKEELIVRMESYIKQVLTFCNENYPDLFYAFDVVNEALENDGEGYRHSNWYNIFGSEEFIVYAFRFARQYANPDIKLFYNDFNTYIDDGSRKLKTTKICELVKRLQEENLIDGVGMQSHLDVSFPTPERFLETLKIFSDLGVDVQITELDVTTNVSPVGYQTQADYYAKIFADIVVNAKEKYNLTSVTIWGVSDNLSWRSSQVPLLFDGRLRAKPAYDSVLQAE